MKVSETKASVNHEVKKDDYDAYVIEYLQTPLMFDFYHKKVNKKKFLKEKEWHPHTLYFQFVPLDFDFKAWKEIIRKTSPDEDFAYNLGKMKNDKSYFFVKGEKRYIVGEIYSREHVVKEYKDCKYIQNGIKFYSLFDRFAITERGMKNYTIPAYVKDVAVHSDRGRNE